MIVLGLVLLVVVVAVTLVVVFAGDDPVRLHLHWFTMGTNGRSLFVAGALTVLVAVIGLWALHAGWRRARRRRREMKELRQRADRTSSGPDGAATGSPAAPPATTSKGEPDADDYYDSAPRD